MRVALMAEGREVASAELPGEFPCVVTFPEVTSEAGIWCTHVCTEEHGIVPLDEPRFLPPLAQARVAIR
jgi:hypothetical protein